jgi:hypothetical protein
VGHGRDGSELHVATTLLNTHPYTAVLRTGQQPEMRALTMLVSMAPAARSSSGLDSPRIVSLRSDSFFRFIV